MINDKEQGTSFMMIQGRRGERAGDAADQIRTWVKRWGPGGWGCADESRLPVAKNLIWGGIRRETMPGGWGRGGVEQARCPEELHPGCDSCRLQRGDWGHGQPEARS